MDINARLEKLERENRRMKKIGIAAAVVVSMFIVGGQAKTNKVVEANEFRLVDASGKVRAELSMLWTEPNLSFRDDDGNEVVALYGGLPSLRLGKAKTSSALLVAGTNGGTKASLNLFGQHGLTTISAGNENTLSVIGSAGSVNIDTDEGQGPSVTVMDHEGYSLNLGRADLEVVGTGRKERTPAASVVLFGKDKKVLWSAP